MSPDWEAKAAAIPYADLSDPQSLNLYSYVRNRPTAMIDPGGHEVKETVDTRTETINYKNGIVETRTTTVTTTFNKDGSVDVTSVTKSTLTQTNPKTGEKTELGSHTSTPAKHHIDRDTEGRIIVNGKIAPRSAGDNIEAVAKTIAAAKDPEGALIELTGHEVGRAVDYSRSVEGKARWDKFWSIDPGYLNKEGKWVTCQGGCPEHPADAASDE